MTKIYQAFVSDFNDNPAAYHPSDLEFELTKSLVWKFYLVATDFMIKYWYPDSDIYGEWLSYNIFHTAYKKILTRLIVDNVVVLI